MGQQYRDFQVVPSETEAHPFHLTVRSIRIWQDQGAGWPRGWVSSRRLSAGPIIIASSLISSRSISRPSQSFVMALIQGAYCFSPIGMLASMADEMKTPETSVPIAMVGGVAIK